MANTFIPLPGRQNIPGTGTLQKLTDATTAGDRFYRVGVSLP